MLIHWIWLATRSGLGDHGKRALLEQFHSPEAVYALNRENLADIPDLTVKAGESILDKDLSGSDKILQDCAKKGINVLTFQDPAYPQRLKNIYDPPVVLYWKGRLPDFDGFPTIGVVGTRKASAYGLQIAHRMGAQLAEGGALVVSGAAGGIDTKAMEGALSAEGRVAAVLGCGADRVYPAANRRLYADTQRQGCLITEFPPGTPPYRGNFPRRNRIISGLSNGVLVVEAPEKSGALITARQAAEQGRDVFTVPGNIDSPTGQGSNRLLKDGAIPVTSGREVLEEYVRLFPDKLRLKQEVSILRRFRPRENPPLKVAQKPQKPAPEVPETPAETKKGIDNREARPYIDLNEIESSLTPAEKAIAGLLLDGQKLVDEVIAESGLSAGSVLASLTLLEVKGIVRRLPGRFIELGRK
ncbi:MAG: DNA-processing protein DprA [Oscillospiraceae bacterium]|nr:DNA-processing protein DprA [Oscillospiraceae bacterium]